MCAFVWVCVYVQMGARLARATWSRQRQASSEWKNCKSGGKTRGFIFAPFDVLFFFSPMMMLWWRMQPRRRQQQWWPWWWRRLRRWARWRSIGYDDDADDDGALVRKFTWSKRKREFECAILAPKIVVASSPQTTFAFVRLLMVTILAPCCCCCRLRLHAVACCTNGVWGGWWHQQCAAIVVTSSSTADYSVQNFVSVVTTTSLYMSVCLSVSLPHYYSKWSRFSSWWHCS